MGRENAWQRYHVGLNLSSFSLVFKTTDLRSHPWDDIWQRYLERLNARDVSVLFTSLVLLILAVFSVFSVFSVYSAFDTCHILTIVPVLLLPADRVG